MRAYAKINLALSVGPPLTQGPAAGYHPIASWFHTIDLFDDVTVEPLPSGSADHYDVRWTPSAPVRSLVDWPLDQDLAVRAHRLIQEHTGRRLPVALTLVKRIPVGAGLGGGSSDAAATLQLINYTFNLNLSQAELLRLSRRLGSDVAYFLDDPPPRPAIVTGAGEHVERLERTAAHLVLILPEFRCPTAAVYGAFDRLAAEVGAPNGGPAGQRGEHTVGAATATAPPAASARAAAATSAPPTSPGAPREPDIRTLARAGWVESRALFNDLTPAAHAVEPRLAELHRKVREASGLPVHLTGTGSALFIPCAEEPEARRLAASLAPGLDAAVVRTRLV
ncbi:MAG: hypothetical protein WD749_14510 [Phycisphaerales bacterium]